MKRMLRSITFGILVLCQASNVWACPMCKMALESDDLEPKAYMISILFMMGMIGTLFSSVAGLLWYVTRQEKLAINAAGYQHLFENAGNKPQLAMATARR